MTRFQIHLVLLFVLSVSFSTFAQETNYYAVTNDIVVKKKFEEIRFDLKFKAQNTNDDALTFGWKGLAAHVMPLLLDGASKLFYNPDNFNKEYFANYSFFDTSGGFKKLDPTRNLVFEQTGVNSKGKQQIINQFDFELGTVENVEGYYYIGLKGYELNYSLSKISSPKNKMNYVIDIGFFYFDDNDKPHEFNINSILLDAQTVGTKHTIIEDVNYQVIPKMNILHTVQMRVREVNSKKANWDRYLEMYQSNQDIISSFMIRAIK